MRRPLGAPVYCSFLVVVLYLSFSLAHSSQHDDSYVVKMIETMTNDVSVIRQLSKTSSTCQTDLVEFFTDPSHKDLMDSLKEYLLHPTNSDSQYQKLCLTESPAADLCSVKVNINGPQPFSTSFFLCLPVSCNNDDDKAMMNKSLPQLFAKYLPSVCPQVNSCTIAVGSCGTLHTNKLATYGALLMIILIIMYSLTRVVVATMIQQSKASAKFELTIKNKSMNNQPERHVIHIGCSQLHALTWKSWIVFFRSWKTSVALLSSPIIMCLILLVFGFISDYVFTRTGGDPQGFDMSEIPRCTSRNNLQCVTITYSVASAHSVTEWEGFMRDVASVSGLDYDRDVFALPPPPEGPTLYDYLSNNQNVTQLGVEFLNCTLPCKYGYNLMYNSTFYPWQDSYVALNLAINRVITTRETKINHKMDAIRYSFPQANSRVQGYDIVGQQGGVFFFIPFVLLLFNNLSELVLEKASRLRLSLRLSGAKDSIYWTINHLMNAGLSSLVTIILMCTGAILQMEFFLNSNVFAVFIVFFSFGFSIGSLGSFLSTFITSSRTAQSVGYLFVFCGFLFQIIFCSGYGGLLNMLWLDSVPLWVVCIRIIFQLYPGFNFSKAFFDISWKATHTLNKDLQLVLPVGYSWEDFSSPRVVTTVSGTVVLPSTEDSVFVMLAMALIFIISTWYFDHIAHNSPWYFVVTKRYWGMAVHSAKPSGISISQPLESCFGSDVVHEREICDPSLAESPFPGVRVFGLSKTYNKGCCQSNSKSGAGHVHALNNVSLSLREGCTALLGVNGAGKSSFCKILTGEIDFDQGEVEMYGYYMPEDTKNLFKILGVCFQHDALYDELTGSEHLWLFASIRDLYSISETVIKSLESVDLAGPVIYKKSCEYSGGMKRRLSVAIAAIGNPKVLVLDEPTTGLDPVNRKQVWKVLEKLKIGRTMLLTSHDMIECDVLSDKCIVLASGRVVASASSLALKRRYSSGYKIDVTPANEARPLTVASIATSTTNPSQVIYPCLTEYDAAILQYIPSASLQAVSAGVRTYTIANEAEIEPFLRFVDEEGGSKYVKSLSLGSASLEDTFITLDERFRCLLQNSEVDDKIDTDNKDTMNDSTTALKRAQNAFSPGNQARYQRVDTTGIVDIEHLENDEKEWVPLDKSSGQHVFRALFRKQLTLQKRQTSTNVCQLLSPLLSIVIIILLQIIVSSQLEPSQVGPQRISTSPIFLKTVPKNHTVGSNCFWKLDVVNEGLYENVDPITVLKDYSPTYACVNTTVVNPLSVPLFVSNNFASRKDIEQSIRSNLQKLELLTDVQLRTSPDVWILPDAYIAFSNFSSTQLSYSFGSNDLKFRYYHRPNRFTSDLDNNIWLPEGRLISQQIVHDAYLNWQLQIPANSSKPLVEISVQAMPQLQYFDVVAGLELLGTFLWPVALSLQLPIYLYILVTEKSTRLLEFMRMYGLRLRHYYAVNYIIFLAWYSLIAGLLWLLGIALSIRLFKDSDPLLMFLVLFGWGNAIVGVSFFISAFIGTPRLASMLGYFASLVGTLCAIVVSVLIFLRPLNTMPSWLLCIPQFGLTRALYIMNRQCVIEVQCANNSWVNDSELPSIVLSLYMCGIVWTLLGMYADAVVGVSYGVPASPLFPVYSIIRFFSSWYQKASSKVIVHSPLRSLGDKEFASVTDSVVDVQSSVSAAYSYTIDTSAEDMQARVDELILAAETMSISERESLFLEYPIVTHNLWKSYNKGRCLEDDVIRHPPMLRLGGGSAEFTPVNQHVLSAGNDTMKSAAVKNLSLLVERGTCLALLGRNGAGKSTTISVMTGLYPPSSGRVLLAGADVVTEQKDARKHFGICPQHDILWDDPPLTVGEHLLLFARLKSVAPVDEERAVLHALCLVQLQHVRDRMARDLSGGMKRRLSCAIAIIGSPRVTIFDEVSSGLDPCNKRELWSILMAARQRDESSQLLTTHDMEEAERLASRVAIIDHGSLRCVGTAQELKTRFGGGYKLSVSFAPDKADAIMDFLSKLIPRGAYRSYVGYVYYSSGVGDVASGGASLATVFGELRRRQTELGIEDWLLASPTLEDVFFAVVDSEDVGDTSDNSKRVSDSSDLKQGAVIVGSDRFEI